MSLAHWSCLGRVLRSPEAGPVAHRLARSEAERAARDGLADLEIAVSVLVDRSLPDAGEGTIAWHCLVEGARCAIHAIAAAQVRLISDPAYPSGEFERLEMCFQLLKSVVAGGSE